MMRFLIGFLMGGVPPSLAFGDGGPPHGSEWIREHNIYFNAFTIL